jgi:YVTN family beta-propeller protein
MTARHNNLLRNSFASIASVAWIFFSGDVFAAAPVYRSPLAVVASTDGNTLYVSDKTTGCVSVLDVASARKIADISLSGEPAGLALSADGKTLYAAQRTAGRIAVIDAVARSIVAQIDVGAWPVAVVLADKTRRLYVCNRGENTISVVDLAESREISRIEVVRDPSSAAITPDETRLIVANYLPQGPGTDPASAAKVSIIDATGQKLIGNVPLPPGSTAAGGVCCSPDGRWAYVVHSLGRFNLPITQLDRGWVHSSAVSIIDIAGRSLKATLLLDDLLAGASDPWAVVASGDGKELWISHAGVHEVSTLDIGRIHALLEGKSPKFPIWGKEIPPDGLWMRIRSDPVAAGELATDLSALASIGAIRRTDSGGVGPRGMALSADGRKMFVANYFSGTISVLATVEGKKHRTIPLGDNPQPDATRRGEIYFHDATQCFQRWHSCATCHLDGGRTDGLIWDFPRDGFGNPKDVISLANMPHTSPHNWRATRPDPRECVRTGVLGSHFLSPREEDVDDLLAYAGSLRTEPNPRLAKIATAAARGKILFEGRAGCAACHPGSYSTDREMHDVGVHSPLEPDGRYDTPSLVEVYRTAPYLHDGRATTIKEVLTRFNPDNKHGTTQDLTPGELDDLAAYVLSL